MAPAMTVALQRLYEYMTYRVGGGSPEVLDEVARLLATVREELEALRTEANELEHSGQLPTTDAHCLTIAAEA